MPRRFAAAALVLSTGALPLVAVALGWRWYLDGPLALLLAAGAGYAAGAWLPRAAAVAGVLLAVAGLVTANQLDDQDYHWLDDVVFFLVLVAGPAVAASVVAARAGQVRRLDLLRTQLDDQQRADVAAARLEMRTRVQQELHAGLAERIAGIAVRAEGAQRSRNAGAEPAALPGAESGSEPDREALAEIETEARGVLDQLRAVLGSLGQDVPEPALPYVDGAAEVDWRRADPPTGEGQPQALTGVPGAVPTDAPGVVPTARAASSADRPGVSLVDVVVAGAIGGALAVETVVIQAARGPAWANVVVALLVAAPLVVRRGRPVALVAATTVAGTLMSLWLTPVTMTVTGVVLLTVVFYTVGAWCRGRWSWLGGWLVASAGTAAMGAAAGSVSSVQSDEPALLVLAWGAAATLLGRVAAGWQERLRRTDAMVGELARGQAAAVRLARAQERQHLAGELHDTVAHAMTVVCLQAAAHRRPGGDAAAALGTISSSAAASLAELREGLDSIEASDCPLEASRIVAIGRRIGVDVDVLGLAPALAGPAATLALRVLRESIVNVARHAPGAPAQVRMGGGEGVVDLEVRDLGGTTGSVLAGSGTGLAGLAEAVRSAGGTLEWGPCRSGGFRVTARIPEVAR